MKNDLYLGIGSNIGDKLGNIERAIKELTSLIEVKKCSSIYETSPWGYKKQDKFLNCIVYGKTKLSGFELLKEINSIEKKLGRERGKKFGPRIIDIDILFYGEEIINTPKLIIPHPLLHLRKFVLVPMVEINPDFVHPVLKKSIKELLQELKSDEVCKKIGNLL